jgi:MFS family permease
MTGNLTLLADLVPPARRAEAVGIFGVSGLMTIALAPAAGEQLFRAWGFPALFAGSSLLGVGALAMTWATRVPPVAESALPTPLGRPFLRSFAPVLTAGFQFGLANSVVFVFLPPFARATGLPRVGPFYLMYTLAAVVVRFVGGGLADRLGRRQVILPSLLALSTGVILLSVMHSTPLLLLVALVNGTAHGFVYPATSALALDLAPRGARGKVLALFNVAVLSGVTMGAFGFGWLVERIGYRPAFVLMGGLLTLGAAAFWRRRP